MNRSSKHVGFSICLFAYAVAGGIAFLTGLLLKPLHPVAIAAFGDLSATAVVFLFSLSFNNTSLYDPYWSVAPLALAGYWALRFAPPGGDLVRTALVLLLLFLWAIRLTYNWARRWQGLDHEDWRYRSFRQKFKKAFWPFSFAAFHLFPTVLVFLGCLPIFAVLSAGKRPFTYLDGVATIITAAAVCIEYLADRQLYRFVARRKDPKEFIESGLWALSRHPNYFGEVLFWWGLYLFSVAADPSVWWLVLGPLAITALFLFISIPMLERRLLETRANYEAYRRRTSALIPRRVRNRSS
jgi:steroid 5-alpha reductase family enzyme